MSTSSDRPNVNYGRILTAGFAGNVLEWYDFAVYGYFAPTIGRLFFPADDPATSLIASFGAFAAGFLMRPVGAVLFGYIGDLFGRKRALTISVVMMAVPTFLVGLLPTHAQIGYAAAALMVLLRMVQGVSVGGEFTSSIVFLVEHAPERHRGLFGAFSQVGATVGILLGSAVGAAVAALTTESQLLAWGWRLPFLAGISIAFVGLAIRHGLPEVAMSEPETGSPLVAAVRNSRRQLLQATGLNLMGAVVFYTVFIYMATWLVTEVGETEQHALEINTLSMVLLAVIVPVVATLSDRIGRKPFLLAGSAGTAVLAYPLVSLMHHPNEALILAGQIGFAVLLGMFCGVVPATIAELFPRKSRVSAASLSYNLPYAVFGGTAPMVAAWLVTESRNAMSVSWYMSAIAAASFLVALGVPESRWQPLEG